MDKTVTQKRLIPKDRFFSNNLDTVLICTGLLVLAFTLYGKAVLYQAAVCVISGALWEYVCFSLILKKKVFRDLGVLATSLLITMLLPASAPLYTGALAVFFAVAVATLPFGDGRNAPFIPAAAGFCFVAILFPSEVFSYPVPSADGILLYGQEGFTKGIDLLTSISEGNGVSLSLFGISSLLSGNIPGAMGTTSLLALAGVFLYRLIRNPRSLVSTLFYLVACGAFAVLLPRLNTDPVSILVTELSAGSLLFTSLMLVNDPVSSPQKPLRAIIYGVLAGVLTMGMRYFTSVYDSPVFAMMIMNLLWPVISSESVSSKLLPKERKKKQKPVKIKKNTSAKSKKEYTPSYDLFGEEAEKGGKA